MFYTILKLDWSNNFSKTSLKQKSPDAGTLKQHFPKNIKILPL